VAGLVQRSPRPTLVALAVVAGLTVVVPAAAMRPLIGIEPSKGAPGQTVTVRGSGFCGTPRCGRVRIQVYTTVAAKGIRVSSRGRFVRRLQIPGGPPSGQIGVIATQRLANGKQLGAFALFEIEISAPATSPQTAVNTRAASRRHAPRSTGPGVTTTTSTHSRGTGGKGSRPKQKPGSDAVAAPGRTDGRDQGGHDALISAVAGVAALVAAAGLVLVYRARRKRRPAAG
jgi:hypothetical protein